MIKKCPGSYNINGHTCYKTCETLTNMLKEDKDVSDQLITSFENSLEYYCHNYYKIDDFIVLYCNKYLDRDIFKKFTKLNKNFKTNLVVFKEIEKTKNYSNLIRVINNFLNSNINIYYNNHIYESTEVEAFVNIVDYIL